ncbi:hypothetical protein D3C76_1262570 [compost metagenome]
MAGRHAQEQLAQNLLAVEGVGGHVQQDDVGLEFLGQGDSGHAIACVTDYGVLFFLFEQRSQARSKERRVIGK